MCTCAARSPTWAPTASRRRCTTSTRRSCPRCWSARRSRTARPPTSAATARRGSSTTSTSTTRARTDANPQPPSEKGQTPFDPNPQPPSEKGQTPLTEFDALGKARDDVERRSAKRGWRPGLREGAIFNRDVIHEIQRAAREGIYDIRGFGAKRQVPHFDDLLFLGASMSRYRLEGYRERCDTDVTLGARHAKEPLHLDIPITIAGMSFGALSGPARAWRADGAVGVDSEDGERDATRVSGCTGHQADTES